MSDKKKGRILKILAALIALPLVALVAAGIFIDPLVRTGVEELATAALKVPATLKEATVKYSGRLILDRLAIANPPGYQEPRAVAFRQFDGAVRVGSLFSDVVEIPHLSVIEPEFTFEFSEGRSNWSVLMDNLAGGEVRSGPKEEVPAAGGGKKFRVGEIRIVDAVVRFRSDLISSGTATFKLPMIEIKDVGTDQSMSELLSRVMSSLGEAALRAAEGELPGQIAGALKGEVQNAARAVGGLLETPAKALQEIPGKVVEDAGRKLEEAGKSIRDLFK